jgi:hypothetical protein
MNTFFASIHELFFPCISNQKTSHGLKLKVAAVDAFILIVVISMVPAAKTEVSVELRLYETKTISRSILEIFPRKDIVYENIS